MLSRGHRRLSRQLGTVRIPDFRRWEDGCARGPARWAWRLAARGAAPAGSAEASGVCREAHRGKRVGRGPCP